MSTLPLRSLRLVLVAAGVAVAAPAFAATAVPLCGDEKHGEKVKNEEKNKSESKKEADKKKPVNQG